METTYPLFSQYKDSPLEPEALARIRALQRPGAPSLVGKIIRLYLSHSPDLVRALREAVAQKNAAALSDAAHGLKSSSANLGATQLAALCRQLEECGREQRLESIAVLLADLETQYGRVREALTAQLAQEAE